MRPEEVRMVRNGFVNSLMPLFRNVVQSFMWEFNLFFLTLVSTAVYGMIASGQIDRGQFACE